MISIAHTFVLSLAIDTERREHIVEHFRQIGVTKYSFVEAIPYFHRSVGQVYLDEGVAPFPPCFRCGEDKCNCANNVLIPQQVANWLSFQSIWSLLPPDPRQYYLICEDDVAFHRNAIVLLNDFLENFVPEKEQVLIRLSNSGEQPFRDLGVNRLTSNSAPMMSNAAYILNGALAARLLQEKPLLTHTSDEWLHREIASRPDIQSVTVDPLLATDLSYNRKYAQFVSRIHPKGIDTADQARQEYHIQRVESGETYRVLRRLWSPKAV